MRLAQIIAPVALLLFSAGAQALPACYRDAMNADTTDQIPAHRWLAMSEADRETAQDIWVIAAVDSHRCRRSEVIDGARVDSDRLGVPFGFLYLALVEAINEKDRETLTYISAHIKPADKDVDALFSLFALVPPGGWGEFKVVARLTDLPTSPEDWLHYGLLDLFSELGGRAIHDCKVHRPPKEMVAPGLSPDFYRNVLHRFGLTEGQVLDDGKQAGQRRFVLEGCVE